MLQSMAQFHAKSQRRMNAYRIHISVYFQILILSRRTTVRSTDIKLSVRATLSNTPNERLTLLAYGIAPLSVLHRNGRLSEHVRNNSPVQLRSPLLNEFLVSQDTLLGYFLTCLQVLFVVEIYDEMRLSSAYSISTLQACS